MMMIIILIIITNNNNNKIIIIMADYLAIHSVFPPWSGQAQVL